MVFGDLDPRQWLMSRTRLGAGHLARRRLHRSGAPRL